MKILLILLIVFGAFMLLIANPLVGFFVIAGLAVFGILELIIFIQNRL